MLRQMKASFSRQQAVGDAPAAGPFNTSLTPISLQGFAFASFIEFPLRVPTSLCSLHTLPLSVCKLSGYTSWPYVFLQIPQLHALAVQHVRARTSLPSSTTDLLSTARSQLCWQHTRLLLCTGLGGTDLQCCTHHSVPVTSHWVFPGSRETQRWPCDSLAPSLKSCSLCHVDGPVSNCQKIGTA